MSYNLEVSAARRGSWLEVPARARALRRARRIAVLGIKPASRAHKAAHYVPRYLTLVGYQIVPVPVYYPDATEILGQPVSRSLACVPAPVDIVSVFRRPEHVAAHVEELLAQAGAHARAPVVWFQSGCLHEPSADALMTAGVDVVHDCIGCRHASLRP